MFNGLGKVLYRFLSKTKFFEEFSRRHLWLKKYIESSGLGVSYRLYVPSLIFLPVISFIILTIVSLPIHLVIIRNYAFSIIASLALGLAGSFVSYGLLMYYPVLKARLRREKLKVLLPYTVSYLNILATAGYSTETIIAKCYEKSDLIGFKEEFKKVYRETYFVGKDIVTALREASSSTPVPQFSIILYSLANLTQTGGDIGTYLKRELEYLMMEREAAMREALNSMGMVMEVFVSGLIVFPLTFIIVMSIISSIGGFPVDPLSLIFLVIFGGVPLIGLILFLLVDSIMSKIIG